MSSLIIPNVVAQNAHLEQGLQRLGRLRARESWLRHFDRELGVIDARLSLVKATEGASAPGLIPGFWHVRRDNSPLTLHSYIPLTDGHGGFSEPHSGHLEMLRRADLQRPGALEELRKRTEKEREDRERARQEAHQARVDEIYGRYRARESPHISVPRSVA